jgi:hypothetical protein
MIKLCEACYRQIGDEPYAVLRSLYKVTSAGRPEWRELYLHHFDPEADNCTVATSSAALRERRAG